ncbi:Mrr N-terminal domain containing protein [Desulfocurvibacter africanus PCS]|uniref:Mrr N-terminal domain containing protein n=1 Tax=Desulfocurvibacter africanus PCS TaxID=1262666 RepID=M5PSQ8_DESAF|nr:winged helix-turn-helix domain-containing protein [Desulfocurvibacter africanus]EMG37154.1 Mrr N-terminal domain containing protein [Desulfocurvibacter africanus PCS]
MSNGGEVERYVKDPSLLVELCREVVERLDAGSDNGETAAMEAQLREIARAIDKLDNLGVPVPDALRAEKTRLAAALGVSAEATQTLSHLAYELEELLNDLKARIGRPSEATHTKKSRVKRSKSPKTDAATLRHLIIEVLKSNGGRAKVAEVLDRVGDRLKGKLMPGDLEVRQDGKTLAWRNNAQWERLRMVHDGILRSDSPNGIWELSGDDRQRSSNIGSWLETS